MSIWTLPKRLDLTAIQGQKLHHEFLVEGFSFIGKTTRLYVFSEVVSRRVWFTSELQVSSNKVAIFVSGMDLAALPIGQYAYQVVASDSFEKTYVIEGKLNVLLGLGI